MRKSLRSTCAVVAAVLAVTVIGGSPAWAGAGHGGIVTAKPDARTPHVLNNKVLDIAQVGNRIVVAGGFSAVRDAPANGGGDWAQRSVFAFDAATGKVDRAFAPVLNGVVSAVEAGPDGTVYLGGTFSEVDGVRVRNLVQVSLSTGARVERFRTPGISGAVNDIALSGGRLFIGGVFTTVDQVPHGGLATLDPVTGALDEYMGIDVTVNHNWPRGTAKAPVGVRDFDISPDGSRLAAVGNFARADGLARDQLVTVLLQPGGAVVDPAWRTTRYEPACDLNFVDSYVRDVDFAPDGSYFVVATTGAHFPGTLCDTAARWDTNATGQAVQPRWIADSGGDTLHSAEVTEVAVYVGGHQRWLNNPSAKDYAGRGAVPRPGIAALDPRTGIPLSWNPGRNPRGIGAEALLATPSGLYVGMDTEYFGNYQHKRPRLGFFPLVGGTALPSEDAGALPAQVVLAGRYSAPARTSVDDVRGRPFDGTAAGSDTAIAPAATAWSKARGGFRVGDTLFYGHPRGDGKYGLWRRSFDGTTFGGATQVDPYNDTFWSTVHTRQYDGKVMPYRGGLPSFYLDDLPNVTSMAYRDGRLYYTRGDLAQLFYRHFSVDSGIVSEDRFVAASSGFGDAAGLILDGDRLFVASRSTGDLRRMAFVGGVPAGPVTVVSGPSLDGRDWRARALFLGARPNQPPSAAIAAECVGLACNLDGRGSTDVDGRIGDYRWDFGDGTTATGPTPSKTYGSAGTWTVRLTVTDDRGASASTTQELTVAPVERAGVALRGSAASTARQVTSVSVAVPDSVRAGDGLVMVLSTNSLVTGTAPTGWTAAGGQTAGTAMTTQLFSRVAAAGDAGSRVTVPLSGTAAVTLQVLAYSGTDPSMPVASVTGASGGAGTSHRTPAARAATGSLVLSIWSDKSTAARTWTAPSSVTERSNLAGAGSGDVATLVADSGPVPAGSVGELTATVPAPSTRATMFTVVLAPGAAAADGAATEDATSEPPPNQPPVAALSSTCAELSCTFDGTGSSDPDGTVATYAWDLGDGRTSAGRTLEHTYAAAGDYTVRLTVTDDAGASVTGTATITVDAAPAAAGIGLRGSAGTAARPVGSVSLDVPRSVRPGDGLVLVLSTNSAVSGTAPAGWTTSGRQTDAGMMTTQVFSRVAAAGDAGARVTVPLTGTAAVTLQLMAYSGTASTGPVVSVTGAAGGAGTEHTTPVATAPTGSWVLSVWSDKAAAARQFVPPTEGMDERSNLAGAGSGDIATLVADSGAPVAGGQVGGLTATLPTASSRATMLTVVLAPAR